MAKKIIINLNEDQIKKRLEEFLPSVPGELVQACIESYSEKELTPSEFIPQIFEVMVKMRDAMSLTDYSKLHNLRRQILLALVGKDSILQKAVNGQCNQKQIG